MFSPLCLAPCRNRSGCGSSPWWRWCSRMRSSSRPSSPSWPRGARVSRRWYGGATARPARSRRPSRTYRQLSAAQLGITVASILLGYVSEDTVAHLFRDWFAALPPLLDFLARGGVASTAAVAVVSFLHVVFGEQAPKAWAITHPERTSRWIAAP